MFFCLDYPIIDAASINLLKPFVVELSAAFVVTNWILSVSVSCSIYFIVLTTNY